MRLNELIVLETDRLYLVPYEDYHVEKYHDWMSSPELQELTASEPLTLQQEFDMQKSWRDDSDKLTFVILDKRLYSGAMQTDPCDWRKAEIHSMIGDVNLFVQPIEEGSVGIFDGELEIMLAEPSARGKGYGSETLKAFMKYSFDHKDEMSLKRFIAKINFSNELSISLFKKLNFVEFNRSEYFKEVHLKLEFENFHSKTNYGIISSDQFRPSLNN